MDKIIEAVTAGIVAVLGGATLLQIAPVKVNPWTWVARAIGRAINAEVIQRVDQLEENLLDLKTKTEVHEAKSARMRILRFGDEILHNVKHSQEHYNQILLDITEYEEYCVEHPEFRNNVTGITTKRIKATYEQCLQEHSFL